MTPQTKEQEGAALSRIIKGLAGALLGELDARYDLENADEIEEFREYLPLFRKALPHLDPVDRDVVIRMLVAVKLDHLVHKD